MTEGEVIGYIEFSAGKLGVRPELARAIGCVESRYNPLAVRFEPEWRYPYQPELYAKLLGLTESTERTLQAMSYGPLQVMGAICRELGFQGNLLELAADPTLAIEFGVKKLKKCVDQFGDGPSAIAAYNAGSPRKVDLGSGAGVRFVNQSYVDQVLARMPSQPIGGSSA